MKNFGTLALLLVFAMGGTAAKASQSPGTKEVAIGLSDAFIPGGFSSASDAYVVASGLFPNSCYTWKRADVSNPDTFTHEVKSFATVSQGMCLMVLVPFNKEIRLGQLAEGKHTLRFLNGDGTFMEKSLTIEE